MRRFSELKMLLSYSRPALKLSMRAATCEIESVETHQIVNGHWLNTVNVLAAAPEARARENAAVKNFIVV